MASLYSIKFDAEIIRAFFLGINLATILTLTNSNIIYQYNSALLILSLGQSAPEHGSNMTDHKQ